MLRLMNKYLALMIALICLIAAICVPAAATEEELDSAASIEIVNKEALIYNYAQTINQKDIDAYIALFTAENQALMSNHIASYGKNDFFHEESVTIKTIKSLSKETGAKCVGQPPLETSRINENSVYYVEMCIDDTETVNKVFVLAKEQEDWKIQRVSTPDFMTIINAGEGLNTPAERNQLQLQENKKDALMATVFDTQLGNSSVKTPDADPTTIRVYFEKAANRNYHNATRKTLDFEEYLKNVIPGEWTVSWYEYYPAYLQAGTMASKMYAWWYIIHPKWDYAPYYSDVVDSSNDQNYLYNSYSSMELRYRNFADAAVNYVRNIAMCDNTGNMFEVHYHATRGSQYSGEMSASGALSLAQQDYSMLGILRYYYNYSSYIGSNKTVVLYGYVS